MAIKTGDIQFAGEHGYLAQPEGASRGGVVLPTTIYGVNRITLPQVIGFLRATLRGPFHGVHPT